MKKTGLFIIILGLVLITFATIAHTPGMGSHHLLWYPIVGITVLGVGALVLQRSS